MLKKILKWVRGKELVVKKSRRKKSRLPVAASDAVGSTLADAAPKLSKPSDNFPEHTWL
jgi:hypothetical protein